MLKKPIITARHLPESERVIIQPDYSQPRTNCIVTVRSTICARRSVSLVAVIFLYVTARNAAAIGVFWELQRKTLLKIQFRRSHPHLGEDAGGKTRAAVIGCCCCRTQVLRLYQRRCASPRHKILSPKRTAALTMANER